MGYSNHLTLQTGKIINLFNYFPIYLIYHYIRGNMRHTKHKHYVYILLFLGLFSHIYPQPIQDLQKMKAEYEKYQKSQAEFQIPIGDRQIVDPTTGIPFQARITPFSQEEEIGPIKFGPLPLKYFGYDFFTRRDTIAFWENLPTPANYLLGPGDELVIFLWGETQLRQTYTISRDGKIYDEKVGLLNLMGKTIEEGQKYLLIQFGRIYATLIGNNPSTYMDISLGQLRSINVNFVGEVKYPGVYPVHPFSNVIIGLIQAGGVDTTGTLRNIQIKRDRGLAISVDLYDYLLKGNLPENIQLRDQDVVVVPVRKSTVKIDSAVVRPGIYESMPGETVSQMIDYAGGLSPSASSSISLKRIIPIEKRNVERLNIENYYIDYASSRLTPIQNNDEIIVRNIFKTLNQVEIIGQVKSPGIYPYFSGMKLNDLIAIGGGFQDTTFLKSVYRSRGELVRRNPETRYESVIEIDLNNIINGDDSENIVLQNLDRFVVHANLNFFEKKNVQILGEVNIPGSYPILRDGETLQSFIDRSGGFTTKAFDEGIEIFRDSLRVAWENTKIPLSPGDSVVIKERSGVVFITGEVYNEGLVEYQRGKSIKYYIDAAGGVTLNGEKNNVTVIYANGVVRPNKFMNAPKIRNGATIIVNRKEPTEPFNPTEFASTTLSLISSLVTIMVLSNQLSQSN